ncbi:MAG: hypothetical protein R3D51_17945 [Hyphomicrobiaceae bacterium]
MFDQAQPDFFTAALITKGDFDAVYASRTRALASSFGATSLHGKDLGIGRLESIAPEFLSLIRSAEAAFYVSRVEKRYLLACKMFDSLFDSGENAAVGWHHYNIRQLRLMLTFKFSTMSPKSSVPQAASLVSQVLMSDMELCSPALDEKRVRSALEREGQGE